MEVVDPAADLRHEHHWLQRLGLQAPPPEADAWVPVARGFLPDRSGPGTSRLAAQLVDELGRAGIRGEQRSYRFYDADFVMATNFPQTKMVTCVAVAVHQADLSRAVDVAKQVEPRLAQEADEPEDGAISEADLDRQALEAGPPPPD